MRKLPVPKYEEIFLFDQALSEMDNGQIKSKYLANRDKIIEAYAEYSEKSVTKSWCELPKAAHGKSNAIICGSLSKAELVSLYDDGVVKSRGLARKAYDEIKLAAHEECPYCGGVGEVGMEGELATADHFLPKARFPSYSVLPLNLVPACFVCNSGMGSNFPVEAHLQPLHPYLDEPHFFDEKWTIASLREEVPLVVDFGVAPPENWPPKDRARVQQHFKSCKLGNRYRSKVSQETVPLISQRRSSLSSLGVEQFRAHLQSVANEPGLPINGWKRTLYSALAASDWFCAYDFT